MRQRTGEMRAPRQVEGDEKRVKRSKPDLRLLTPLPPAEQADETAEWINQEAEQAGEKRKLADKAVFAKAREKQLAEARAVEQAKIEEIKQRFAEQDDFRAKAKKYETEDVDKVLQGLVDKMRGLNSRRSELESQLAKQSSGVFGALRRFKIFSGSSLELEIAKIDDEILMVETQMESAIDKLHAFSFKRKGSQEEQILKGVERLAPRDDVEIGNWFVNSEAEFIEKVYHGNVIGGGWIPEGGSFIFYEDGLRITLDEDGKRVLFSLPDGRNLERTVQDLSAKEISILVEHQRLHKESDVGSQKILEDDKVEESNRDAIENWFVNDKADYGDDFYDEEGVTRKTREALDNNVLPPLEQKYVERLTRQHIVERDRIERSLKSLDQTIKDKFREMLGDDFDMGDWNVQKTAWKRLLLKARLGKLHREFAQLENEYKYISAKFDVAQNEVTQDEIWKVNIDEAAINETLEVAKRAGPEKLQEVAREVEMLLQRAREAKERPIKRMLQRRARAAQGSGEKTGLPAL